MANDWNKLCAQDAAGVIILAAIAQKAKKIHVARDSEGATIFFLNGFDMICFDRLPRGVDERICEFFMQLGGIEFWKKSTSSGIGVYVIGGMDVSLTINVVKGSQGHELIIIPEICHR